SGHLIFNPGEVSKTIFVDVNGDTKVEATEAFFINLTNASATATVTKPQGVGTIVNDDSTGGGTGGGGTGGGGTGGGGTTTTPVDPETKFVTQVYQDLLHRAPDDAGKTYWVSVLK